MTRCASVLFALAAVCAAASTAAAADGVLVVETSTVNGSPRATQVQIVDAAGAQMGDAMAQMQKALEGMPPAQRAQMEAMMKGRLGGLPGAGGAPKTEYRRGGTSKVSKWTCDVYEGFQNNAKTGEVCTVSASALGFTATDFEVSQQLAAFMRGLIPQGADQVFQAGRVQEQGYEGVPVRRVTTIAGREMVTELTSVARQTFPESLFAIPDGFTKTAGGFGRGRGRGRQ
jgi:hypothetical protein